MAEYQTPEAAEFNRRYKLTCRLCGSENVVLSVNDGFEGSDATIGDPDEVAFGCNDCKKNDYTLYPYRGAQ